MADLSFLTGNVAPGQEVAAQDYSFNNGRFQPNTAPDVEQEKRKAGWKQALSGLADDPDALMTLFVLGNTMAQGGNAGQGMQNAMLYQGQLAKLRQAQADRQRSHRVEDQKLAMEARRVTATEGNVDVARTRNRLLEEEGVLNRKKFEAGAAGRKADTARLTAMARKYEAETKQLDTGMGAKPGANQQLITFMAKKAMDRGGMAADGTKFGSENEAVQYYFNKVISQGKGKTAQQFRDEIMSSVLSQGTATQKDINELTALLDQTFPGAAADNPGTATDAPVQVKTIEEALALPKGTQFLDPNGVLRVR